MRWFNVNNNPTSFTVLTYDKISKPFDSPANKAEPRRTIGKGKNFNKVAKDKSATGGAAGTGGEGGEGSIIRKFIKQ